MTHECQYHCKAHEERIGGCVGLPDTLPSLIDSDDVEPRPFTSRGMLGKGIADKDTARAMAVLVPGLRPGGYIKDLV